MDREPRHETWKTDLTDVDTRQDENLPESDFFSRIPQRVDNRDFKFWFQNNPNAGLNKHPSEMDSKGRGGKHVSGESKKSKEKQSEGKLKLTSDY